MTGKDKCTYMRSIRERIAKKNNINYEPRVCNHEGDCPGYCEVCDKEAQDLMEQLKQIVASGKRIELDRFIVKELRGMGTPDGEILELPFKTNFLEFRTKGIICD